MWGLKRVAALLLPALTNSLVLPSKQLSRPFDHLVTEGPALRLPFVYEYHATHEASIQFTLQTEGQDATLEQHDSELISVVVPGSDAKGCSAEPNTHIQVNGETLVSSDRQVVDGQVIQRSGTSPIPFGSARTTVDYNLPPSSWTLQCACLDVLSSLLDGARSECEHFGYVLNFQRRSGPNSATEDGFTLSFTQSSQPKLLRLTSLAVSTIEASKSIVQDIANSRHWLAPLLHPIDTLIGQVPTSTLSQLLPKISTTSAQSFRTVTTPLHSVTTRPTALEASSPPEHLVTSTPSQVSDDHTSSTSLALHDELDEIFTYDASEDSNVRDFLDETFDESFGHSEELQVFEQQEKYDAARRLRQFFIDAGRRAQKTFHAVVDQLIHTHDAIHKCKSVHAVSDHLWNEDCGFLEGHQINGTLSGPPETPEVSFMDVFFVCFSTFTGVGGTVFACIYYRDPRRRAERAARREEQLNRRLYKKAAFRHKFQNWFNQLRGRETYQPQSQTYAEAQLHTRNPSRDSDLEWHDKGESGGEAQAPEVHGVHKEIGELREAHGFVEGILRATSGIYRSNRKRTSSRGSRHRRYSDAGSEKSMLPPYTAEDECEDQIIVVDGLHFTARRRRDVTPASSIIDTSPRESDCGSSDGEKDSG